MRTNRNFFYFRILIILIHIYGKKEKYFKEIDCDVYLKGFRTNKNLILKLYGGIIVKIL